LPQYIEKLRYPFLPKFSSKMKAQTMKAQILKSFGGPEAFELQDVAMPVPQAGQVLVRVHATSINPLDYQVRRGDYPDYVPLPAITGHDVSGVVESVGPGVTSFVPGDEVWYTPQIFDGPGSYAEYHVASEKIIGKKPASLSHLEAASLTLVGGTAWEALVVRAGLRVGESILIHGGAGGVGHVAIQLAKAIGAKVFTTVREDNFEFAQSLGADVLIDYTKEDYVDAILRETDGHGVDVIFDTIGGNGPTWPCRLDCRYRTAAEPDRSLGQKRQLPLRVHPPEPGQA
jgi:NADPH:quinone reductase-like Zn-dependent oxidoreductase